MKFSWYFAVFFCASAEVTHAHWGHVGELAGHGHWIAVGAVVIAGALAGLLGKSKDGEAASPEQDSEADLPEGETT